MPDPAVELFLRVVETGSLKATAAEIRADPSSVSRRIAALEARLGAKLLIRSTRRSRPTEAGQAYYDAVRKLAAEEAALEAEIAGLSETPKGLLRVTAPVDFGARFVAPVAERLLKAHPGLIIDLQLGSGFSDLREAGVDVAIRIGRLSDSALMARKLGTVPRVLVASEGYLREHGTPTHPNALADHTFVFYKPVPPGPLDLRFSNGAQTASVSVSARIAANSVAAVRALVIAGCGFHHGPIWAFEDWLADGRLKAVLPDWSTPALPLQGVFLPGPYRPAKQRVFLDALAEQVKAEPSLLG